MTDAESWGLAALGVAGDVYVELIEALHAPRWKLEVDIGQFSFNCELRSPELLREIAAFFAETFRTGRFLHEQVSPGHFRHMQPKELALGSVGGVPIILSKDGEFDDRYFLLLELPGWHLSYTPTLEQTEHLIAAVGQALGQLDDAPAS